MEPDTTSLRKQVIFWLIAAALLILFLFVFSSILLPFVAGLALAYFLDPVADWLEAHGLSRLFATIVILIFALMILVLGLVLVVPLLATQLTEFITRIPGYIGELQALFARFDPQWIEEMSGVSPENLQDGLRSLLQQGAAFLTALLQSAWNSGKALIDLAGLFVVTPVVAFYMLLDWDHMIERVDSWIPRDHVKTVRSLAAEIDRSIAAFVRGQGTVCILLGVFYAIGLTAVGLNFGLLIGLFAGIVSFIPYVGSLVGFVLAMGVALVQFGPEWVWLLATALVFFTGQFIEGNILQPKLVGRSVGLHPVWLMFALFAFGSLFGFVGMLIAVPASAAVGVLVRFALAKYLASPLYKGHRGA